MPEPKSFPRAPRWKKATVFILALRNGDYGLFQMLQEKGRIAVFNHFRSADSWDHVSLNASSILFFAFATTAFFRRSAIRRVQEVTPVANLEYPAEDAPRIDTGSGFRKLTFWPGTAYERTVLTMGTGENSLISWTRKGLVIQEHVTPLPAADYDQHADSELTGLEDYPTLNERILLCRIFGRNFDPAKEIAFDRSLPVECTTYIDIIGGQVRLSKLGY